MKRVNGYKSKGILADPTSSPKSHHHYILPGFDAGGGNRSYNYQTMDENSSNCTGLTFDSDRSVICSGITTTSSSSATTALAETRRSSSNNNSGIQHHSRTREIVDRVITALQKKVQALENEMNVLERENNILKTRVQHLEDRVSSINRQLAKRKEESRQKMEVKENDINISNSITNKRDVSRFKKTNKAGG